MFSPDITLREPETWRATCYALRRPVRNGPGRPLFSGLRKRYDIDFNTPVQLSTFPGFIARHRIFFANPDGNQPISQNRPAYQVVCNTFRPAL